MDLERERGLTSAMLRGWKGRQRGHDPERRKTPLLWLCFEVAAADAEGEKIKEKGSQCSADCNQFGFGLYFDL